MNASLKTLSIIALLGLGTALSAQETTTEPAAEAPAAEAPAAEPAAEAPAAPPTKDTATVGQSYVNGENGDWIERCIKTEDGTDPCQMYQLLIDGNGNAVAEIAIIPLAEGGEAVTGISVVAPLETLLTQPMTISIDGAEDKRYAYTVCSARPLSPLLSSGCLARIGLTADELAQFKRGNLAKLTVVPAADPENKVELSISLTGFTAAYDALSTN